MKWSMLYKKKRCQQCGILSKGRWETVKQENLLYRVLFLLHLLLSAILEDPLDNIGFGRDTLDMVAFLNLGPEVMKILKFNQVPDLGERGGNH